MAEREKIRDIFLSFVDIVDEIGAASIVHVVDSPGAVADLQAYANMLASGEFAGAGIEVRVVSRKAFEAEIEEEWADA